MYKRERRLTREEAKNLEEVIATLHTNHLSRAARAQAKGKLLADLRTERGRRQAELTAGTISDERV